MSNRSLNLKKIYYVSMLIGLGKYLLYFRIEIHIYLGRHENPKLKEYTTSKGQLYIITT